MAEQEHHDEEPRSDEQEQLAREIGAELTDAFVAYVRGDVLFEDLTFGIFDALSDLHVIASGEYELEISDEDHEHSHEEEAIAEQEELSQEPSGS